MDPDMSSGLRWNIRLCLTELGGETCAGCCSSLSNGSYDDRDFSRG